MAKISDFASVYLASLLSFVLTFYLAKNLSTNSFSYIIIALAMGAFLSHVYNLGSDKVLIRKLFENVGIENEVIASNLFVRLLIALASIPMIFVFCLFYMGEKESALIVSVFAIWVSLRGLNPVSLYDLSKKIGYQNNIILAERLSSVMIVFALVYWGLELESNILALAVVLLFIRLSFLLLQYLAIKPYINYPRTNVATRRNILNIEYISIPLAFSYIFNSMSEYGLQLVLGNIGNPEEVAVYGFSFQLISTILLFQGLMARYQIRELSNEKSLGNKPQNIVLKYSIIIGFGSILAAIMLYFIFGYLQRFLNPEYSKVREFFVPLMIWVTITGFAMPVSQYLVTLKKENSYLTISMSLALVALVSGIVLAPIWGAMGIAWIMVSVKLVAFILYVNSAFLGAKNN